MITLEDGQQYETVDERLAKFRSEHTIEDGWGTHSGILNSDEKSVTVRAWITKDGREVASGLASEEWGVGGYDGRSCVEVAETSAMGRALAFAGFGFGSIASGDEVKQAKFAAQAKPMAAPVPVQRQAPPPSPPLG